MSVGSIIDQISPHARVATALVPFIVAIVLRLLLGKNRFTRAVLSVATMWFAINVLLAPYSVEMRREILSLGTRWRTVLTVGNWGNRVYRFAPSAVFCRSPEMPPSA